MNGEKVLSVETLEIVDCPFCHASVVNQIGVCTVSGYGHAMSVLCPHCGIRGPVSGTAEGAIQKWNLSEEKTTKVIEHPIVAPFAMKPCPFCGSMMCQESYLWGDEQEEGAFFCDACNSRGPHCDTIEDARAAWNQRDSAPVVTPFAMKHADPATLKNFKARSTSELVMGYCTGTLRPAWQKDIHDYAVAEEILKSRGVDIDAVSAAVADLLESIGLSFERIALAAFEAGREQEETK